MTRRLACVFAHPDDDTYAVGGTIALQADQDPTVTVIMTTSGDAGRIADPSLATRETLGRVREAEDRASWRALGIEPDIRFLRHRDGALANIPVDQLVAEYLNLLLMTRPEVVVTFGPDGVTGHEDHIAVGAAATEAFHAAREAAGGDGFRRLLYVALRQSRLDSFNEVLRERGMDPLDPTQPFMPRGVPDASIGVSVDCSAAFRLKVEALRCHRTQGEMEDLPYDLWPEVLGLEEFVQAWPERESEAPALAGVFEGIPDPG